MSTAFPLLLRSDHRILRNESCSGYVDIFGIWNTGFYCPQSESKSAVYCCGTDTYKYCCTTTKTTNPEDTSEVPVPTVFIRTPIIIGVVTGFIIMAAFVILTVCFICPCCFFYKKRTAHIPAGLYRIQCGTSSTTSALVNLHSPLSSGNTPLENNNMWSQHQHQQHQPRIFTTMTPPYNNCRGVGVGIPTDTFLPSSYSNSNSNPNPNSNNYFQPSIPQINNNNQVPPINNFLRSFSSRTNNRNCTNWNMQSYCDQTSMHMNTGSGGGTTLCSHPNYHQLLGTSNTAPYYANLLHSQHPTFRENNFPCASTTQIGTPTPAIASTNENHPWGSLTFPSNHTANATISSRESDLTTASLSATATATVSRSVNQLSESENEAGTPHSHTAIMNSSPATPAIHGNSERTNRNPALPVSFPKSTTKPKPISSSDPNQFNSLSRIAALLQMSDTPNFSRSSCSSQSQSDVLSASFTNGSNSKL